LSFYINPDNQYVKIILLYFDMTLDQKSSGSSPDGATKSRKYLRLFVVTEGREACPDSSNGMRAYRGALTEQRYMPVL
jgi:hypothetical protein